MDKENKETQEDQELQNVPRIELDHRKGITVQELINLLSNIEDKTKYVACPMIGLPSYDVEGSNILGVTNLKEIEIGGYAGSYSFHKTKIVLLY